MYQETGQIQMDNNSPKQIMINFNDLKTLQKMKLQEILLKEGIQFFHDGYDQQNYQAQISIKPQQNYQNISLQNEGPDTFQTCNHEISDIQVFIQNLIQNIQEIIDKKGYEIDQEEFCRLICQMTIQSHQKIKYGYEPMKLKYQGKLCNNKKKQFIQQKIRQIYEHSFQNLYKNGINPASSNKAEQNKQIEYYQKKKLSPQKQTEKKKPILDHYQQKDSVKEYDNFVTNQKDNLYSYTNQNKFINYIKNSSVKNQNHTTPKRYLSPNNKSVEKSRSKSKSPNNQSILNSHGKIYCYQQNIFDTNSAKKQSSKSLKHKISKSMNQFSVQKVIKNLKNQENSKSQNKIAQQKEKDKPQVADIDLTQNDLNIDGQLKCIQGYIFSSSEKKKNKKKEYDNNKDYSYQKQYLQKKKEEFERIRRSVSTNQGNLQPNNSDQYQIRTEQKNNTKYNNFRQNSLQNTNQYTQPDSVISVSNFLDTLSNRNQISSKKNLQTVHSNNIKLSNEKNNQQQKLLQNSEGNQKYEPASFNLSNSQLSNMYTQSIKNSQYQTNSKNLQYSFGNNPQIYNNDYTFVTPEHQKYNKNNYVNQQSSAVINYKNLNNKDIDLTNSNNTYTSSKYNTKYILNPKQEHQEIKEYYLQYNKPQNSNKDGQQLRDSYQHMYQVANDIPNINNQSVESNKNNSNKNYVDLKQSSMKNSNVFIGKDNMIKHFQNISNQIIMENDPFIQKLKEQQQTFETKKKQEQILQQN